MTLAKRRTTGCQPELHPKLTDQQIIRIYKNIKARQRILRKILIGRRPPKIAEQSALSIYYNLLEPPIIADPQGPSDRQFNKLVQYCNSDYQYQIQRMEDKLGGGYFDQTSYIRESIAKFQKTFTTAYLAGGEKDFAILLGACKEINLSFNIYFDECLLSEMESQLATESPTSYYPIDEKYTIKGDTLVVEVFDNELFGKFPIPYEESKKHNFPLERCQINHGPRTDPKMLKKPKRIAYARENDSSTRKVDREERMNLILKWVHTTSLEPFEDAEVAQMEDENPGPRVENLPPLMNVSEMNARILGNQCDGRGSVVQTEAQWEEWKRKWEPKPKFDLIVNEACA